MIPEHYSRDIALRCDRLLDCLLPIVAEKHEKDFGGPLATTLLVALSVPMIVLPMERLYKPGLSDDAAMADDRTIDPHLAKAVEDVLGLGKPFNSAPFAMNVEVSYCERQPAFNIASGWNKRLLDALGSDEARDRAQRTDASKLLRDLRNALAHGGIAYLDAGGHQTDSRAEFIAFVGASRAKRPVEHVNVLRISERHYRQFLRNWCRWLYDSGVSEALSREVA